MKFNARKASLAPPGVTGIARVGTPTSTVIARLRPGDIAVLDHVDLDRDSATALVEAGVRAVVNAAPMISGRYANLGPEVLAEAGVLLVDRIGKEGVDRIRDNRPIRVDDGVIHAVLPDGQTEELATGRVLDLDQVHSEMDQARSDLAGQLDTLTHTTRRLPAPRARSPAQRPGPPRADHPDQPAARSSSSAPPTTPICRQSARSSASRRRWSSPSAPRPTTCSA